MDKEIFKIYKDTRKNSNRGVLWEVSNYGNVRKNGEEYLPLDYGWKYLLFGSYKLHRAVAELFVPNPEHKKTVDHINRNTHDNRASNLRWATYQEQAANRDNEAISKANLGNKNSLGHKHSEETRAKMRATHLGRSHRPSEEARAKNRAAILGSIWVFNPTTEHSARVNPSQLNDYLTKGYIRGRKIKK